MTDRACGECSVCCWVAVVPGLKAGHESCRYQQQTAGGCCAVFGTAERPDLCLAFGCQWLRGLGTEADRPDRIGAMFTINATPGGVIGFVGEVRDDALLTTARDMAVTFARAYGMPLVVVPNGTDDGGSYVVLEDGLRDRASAMIGPAVATLAPGVTMYERRAPDG